MVTAAVTAVFGALEEVSVNFFTEEMIDRGPSEMNGSPCLILNNQAGNGRAAQSAVYPS